MFIRHSVELEVRRTNGRDESFRLKLFDGDSFDHGFRERYETPVWMDEKILRFQSTHATAQAQAQVTIHNRSDAILKCVRVNAEDLFVFVDVAPRTKVTVSASSSAPSELLYFAAAAWKASSRPFVDINTDFELSQSSKRWQGEYIVTFYQDGRMELSLEPPLPRYRRGS